SAQYLRVSASARGPPGGGRSCREGRSGSWNASWRAVARYTGKRGHLRQLIRQDGRVRGWQRAHLLLAHVRGRRSAQRLLVRHQRDDLPLACELVAHAPDREDVVGHIGSPYRRKQRLVPRRCRRPHDDDLLRAVEAEVERREERGCRGRYALEDRRERTQGRFRSLPAPVVGRELGEPQQVQRRDRVPRRNSPVGVGLLPSERHLVLSAGEEEAPLLRVPEVASEDVLERDRLAQPAELERRLVEIEEPGGQVRVVVEEGVLVRGAVGEAPAQTAVRAHPLVD